MATSTPDYENDEQIFASTQEHANNGNDFNKSRREEEVGIECEYADIDLDNAEIRQPKLKTSNRTSKYDEDLYALPDLSESSTPSESPSCDESPQASPDKDVSAFNEKKKSQKLNKIGKWTKWCSTVTCIVTVSLVVGSITTYFLVSSKDDMIGVYPFGEHYVNIM